MERVDADVRDAAQKKIEPFQPVQGLDVGGAVAHGQVVALHQLVAEEVGEVEVFEIGLVGRPGRQQHDVGLVARARAGTTRWISREVLPFGSL